ncbi:MAG: nitroreductase family protein [Bacteroidota bacterium]
MSISTSRTSGNANVSIDHSKCTRCLFCVKVCKGMPLYFENNMIQVDQSRLFGCIACGQCVAICPFGAIKVEGRLLNPSDVVPIPLKENRASYEHVFNLMFARRSVRDFHNQEIEQEVIDKILKAASCAPMGIPPSDVRVVVLNGKDKVKEFSGDFIQQLSKIRWMFSKFSLIMMRPFISKTDYELFNTFLTPVIDFLIEKDKADEDWLLYGSPLAIGFFGGQASDPLDADIAATYASIAAESLGVGSCFIGTVPIFLKYGAKKMRNKYHILPFKYGAWIIFGYSKYSYHQSIHRTFADISYYQKS